MGQTINKLDQYFIHLAKGLKIPGFLDKALKIFVRIGDGYFWPFVLVFLIYSYPGEWVKIFVRILLGALFGLTVYLAVKNIIRRPRPFVANKNIEARVPPVDKFSFPSGHVMNNFTTALLCTPYLFHLGLGIAIVSVVWALLRVYYGVHYFTDVLAGIILGYVCFIIANIVMLHYFPLKF